MNYKKCPICVEKLKWGREYRGTTEDYDGVSEWEYECGHRIGRWSGKELKDGEIEKRYGGVNE